MRLVEQVADGLVLKHALIHASGDGKAMRLKRRDRGLDQRDGAVAEIVRHAYG